MSYVTSLRFDYKACFFHLKMLAKRAANDAKINIYDDVFDWSILLTQRRHQQARREQSEQNPLAAEKQYASFKFKTYDDVANMFKQASANRLIKELKNSQKNAEPSKKIQEIRRVRSISPACSRIEKSHRG